MSKTKRPSYVYRCHRCGKELTSEIKLIDAACHDHIRPATMHLIENDDVRDVR